LDKSVSLTLLPDGWLGVSFFFILSGFILTHVYSHAPISALDFYRKRFARIYPLHAVTFVLWALIFFRGWGNSLPDKLNSGIANILLLQAFFSGSVFNLGYNAVSWTISVEAFFYLLFPVLLRPRVPLLVLAVWTVGLLLMTSHVSASLETAFPSFFVFNPVPRLLEFVAGMALYKVFTHWRPSRWLATITQSASVAVLFLAIAATVGMDTQHRNVALLLPFAGVILSFAYRSHCSPLLETRWMVVLGECSFAFYMIHHMIFRGMDEILVGNARPLVALGAALTVAIAASVLVHYGFERPLRMVLSRSQRDSLQVNSGLNLK
jgi:peptidoglycan/LPS O-acetylase OafA/YrhL